MSKIQNSSAQDLLDTSSPIAMATSLPEMQQTAVDQVMAAPLSGLRGKGSAGEVDGVDGRR